MTLEEVKEEFRKKGITRKEWAKQRKLNYRTVISVMNGTNKGEYGEAHRVAVTLGLKEGEAA
ncbi:DNA-binding protein [Methylobacter sp.]|uniref:DNA-binding protein n=1 Tax=Methylobacter sp. TaxID=2051955 RepID=UPI002486EB14|nr:DNA-binding protein [Methylobacter sp.]MDI1279269.1 DNA-binding protein [Methylobacter sp.]